VIVLDEQLLGRGLERSLGNWYRGAVVFITDLRPGTVIKDESIPAILNREADALFVTINDSDFWRKIAISARFCVVCVPIPDSQVGQLDPLLRRLLRHPQFRTKALRKGRVIRLTNDTLQYYSVNSPLIQTIADW